MTLAPRKAPKISWRNDFIKFMLAFSVDSDSNKAIPTKPLTKLGLFVIISSNLKIYMVVYEQIISFSQTVNH